MAAFRIHKDQRLALLRGVGLFSGCSNTELNRIGSLMTMVELVRREAFWSNRERRDWSSLS